MEQSLAGVDAVLLSVADSTALDHVDVDRARADFPLNAKRVILGQRAIAAAASPNG